MGSLSQEILNHLDFFPLFTPYSLNIWPLYLLNILNLSLFSIPIHTIGIHNATISCLVSATGLQTPSLVFAKFIRYGLTKGNDLSDTRDHILS